MKIKYIDAKTQNLLKQGVMEFLNFSACEMIQIFMSIYEDTEKEPWEWVGSSFICDENLILRFSDDAHIKPEWFVKAEDL